MPRWISLGGEPGEPAGYPYHAFPWGQDWLELAPGLSEADWVVEGIRGWLNDRKQDPYLECYIPGGFDAYARLLHPAYRLNDAGERVPVRWAEIAAQNGLTNYPRIGFYHIHNLRRSNPGGNMHLDDWPSEGRLPSAECQVLAALMQEFTGSPERHYFCFWDGYGQEEFFPALRGRPKVCIDLGIDLRNYFLFRGRLDSGRIEQAFRSRSPNIWWPADRAWCIITDIDAMETWVGGSAVCIERILNHPQLEVLPITLDAWSDSGG